MVIRLNKTLRERGALMVEALVAIALLVGVLLPVAYSILSEKNYLRQTYVRAIAMEIVDGEMEVLAAGGWRASTNGVFEFPVHADARTNLPPGQFLLSITNQTLRLEWRPENKSKSSAIVRTIELK